MHGEDLACALAFNHLQRLGLMTRAHQQMTRV